MDWAGAAKAAFGISLAVLVFGSGLGARFDDVSALLRRPGRGERAGGRAEYGLGLVFILAVLAVPAIAVAAVILEALFGRDYVVTPWAVGRLLILSMLLPLAAGMALARMSPTTARRISVPIETAQRWLLPIAMVVLLISAAPQMLALIGNHTLGAIGIFVMVSFAAGHLLGGPDRRDATVLAFATSCRHPATALASASANFPDSDEHAAVALYGLVTAAVGAAYAFGLRRRRSVGG